MIQLPDNADIVGIKPAMTIFRMSTEYILFSDTQKKRMKIEECIQNYFMEQNISFNQHTPNITYQYLVRYIYI